jgi:MoaA/NifB/PqqE/SkfB family radical SAM enzyme
MKYEPLTSHNIMELWLFDTCNFRCGYCGLVSSGAVTQTEQLDPYRDTAYVDSLIAFFRTHRPQGRPWAVLLTGGEPMLMPNLDRFVVGLGRLGDCVGIYTNMSASVDKVLSPEAIRALTYLEASFHPDWHMGQFETERFFQNVTLARSFDIPVLVRFVAAPQVLDLLPWLETRCREIGVTFLPTTLFNPEYPNAYKTEEKARIASHMVGYSSLMQLDGGLVMNGRRCSAADRIFAARLHQNGDVTPCISTDRPILGNVFANTLVTMPGLKGCMRPDQTCSCDIHFQQAIVEGADDSREFVSILHGNGQPRAADYEAWKERHGIETSSDHWTGQGVTVISSEDLLRKAPTARRNVKVDRVMG